MEIQNFGRNVVSKPKYYYEPKSESEVLDILEKHKKGQIRAVGSGHAWSHGIESNDAFVDIKNLKKIEIKEESGKKYVYVGGGCKLENLIQKLRENNLMIPAMGGIMKQSVAGLCSTATHGTGKSSFSHYVEQIKVGGYDNLGNPKIFTYSEGEKLMAARTAIGLMGIIIEIKIPLIDKYLLKEQSKMFNSIDEVLKAEEEWPLIQTVVFPYSWKFFSFQRKVVEKNDSPIKTFFLRFVDLIYVEIMPHVILKTILILKDRRNAIVWYYKKFLPNLLTGMSVTNEDYLGLTHHTRHHYYFRHVEMEVFIPEKEIREAYRTIIEVVNWHAGITDSLGDEIKTKIKDRDLLERLTLAKGKYVLHYTSFIRKVFPDDSLVGMTEGGIYYALGFFTYDKEEKRSGYYEFTKMLAEILTTLHNTRLHWGKHFPLEYKDIKILYPKIERFKEITKDTDPNGVFRNNFTNKVFGF